MWKKKNKKPKTKQTIKILKTPKPKPNNRKMRQKEKKMQHHQEKNLCKPNPPKSTWLKPHRDTGALPQHSSGSSTKAASSYPCSYSRRGQLSHEENHSFPTPPALIFAAFWSKHFAEYEIGVCLGFFFPIVRSNWDVRYWFITNSFSMTGIKP